jgi:hypothetical protein
MWKSGVLLLPLLLLAASCGGPEEAPARNARPAGYPRSLEPASCASYDLIDRKALERLEAALAGRLQRAAAVRSATGIDLVPPPGYEAGRVTLTNLQYGWVHDEAVVAFAAPDGRWWVRSKVVGDHARPDGLMPPEAARALNESLAEPCLWTEPTYMPNPVPLKIGRDYGVADGASFVLDIEMPGRRRVAFQQGNLWGYTGSIRNALYHALYPPPD